ncbi:MAG: hypothetical protein HY884_05675 [Deltaproteobacteria bacterium]|nr:hypothetical protein [Deltaproteobacteria bacterium]
MPIKEYSIPIIITLAAVVFLSVYSIRPYAYNFSAMIRISKTENPGPVQKYFQKGMVVFGDKGGYDGQAYYLAAMDPFMSEGVYKDAYRQQRILYPVAARVLALGNAQWLPYSMFLVNIIALGAGMVFFIAILRHYGASSYWSFFYGLAPPSIMTIQYDLPSPLSIALIVSAVYFYVVKKSLVVTAVFMALAFLTREDSVMALIPMLVWDYQKEKKFSRIAVLLSALVPFFLWQFFIAYRLGDLPAGASATVINPIPFYGIVSYFGGVEFSGVRDFFKILSCFVVLIFFAVTAVAGAAALREKRAFFLYVVAAYVLLVPFTVSSQWDNFNGLLRMFYGIFPFLVLSFAAYKGGKLKPCVYAIAFLSFLTLVRVLFVSPVYPFEIW